MYFSQPDTDVSLSPVICSPAASAASTRRTHHDVKQPPWPRPPPPLSYSWREVGSSRRSRGLQAEHRSGATTAQRRGKGMGMDSVAAYWSHTTLQKVSQNKSLQKMSADNLGADHECIEWRIRMPNVYMETLVIVVCFYTVNQIWTVLDNGRQLPGFPYTIWTVLDFIHSLSALVISGIFCVASPNFDSRVVWNGQMAFDVVLRRSRTCYWYRKSGPSCLI